MEPPRFKAIETFYDGYRMRSRLEARWSVFFDKMGIKWEYESEGYSLDGVPYLPDFWLPEQDCWIEIKGKEPTVEEMQKAEKLALYTGKDVYIIYGNIGFSRARGVFTHRIDGFSPPSLVAHKKAPGDQARSKKYRRPRKSCPFFSSFIT